VSYNKLHVVLL
jgi:hypothetical protein